MAKPIITGAKAPAHPEPAGLADVRKTGSESVAARPLPKKLLDLAFDATVEIECLTWLQRRECDSMSADEPNHWLIGNALGSIAQRIGRLNSVIMTIVTEKIGAGVFDDLYREVHNGKPQAAEEVAA